MPPLLDAFPLNTEDELPVVAFSAVGARMIMHSVMSIFVSNAPAQELRVNHRQVGGVSQRLRATWARLRVLCFGI